MVSIVGPGRIKFFLGLMIGFIMTSVIHNFTSVYTTRFNDDDSTANTLFNKVRVLCWVMTTKTNHQKKAIHVKNTWGKRCNKLLFISDSADSKLPSIRFLVPLGREHLTAKTMQAFDFLFKTEVNNYDWFLKADDDTYVIVENLRYLLSAHNPDDAVYFGHHFKNLVHQGYMAGGAGYAVSREALKRYGNRKPGLCYNDYGNEDVEFGRCMEDLGVKPGDSRDKQGRTRFHHFKPAMHIHGNYPYYYKEIDKYDAKKGMKSVSDYPVSFHYVDSKDMYNLEYFVYHLWPYGIDGSHQELNSLKPAWRLSA